jgi:hypothetical protein
MNCMTRRLASLSVAWFSWCWNTTGRKRFFRRFEMKTITLATKLALVVLIGIFTSSLSGQITPPVSGGFAPTGTLNSGRNWHTATMLNDGTVLIAGGMGSYSSSTSALNTAEVYDPSTGLVTPTAGNMNSAHAYATGHGDGCSGHAPGDYQRQRCGPL